MSEPVLDILKDIHIYKEACIAESFEITGFKGSFEDVEYNMVFIKANTFNNFPVYLNLTKKNLTETIRILQFALRKQEMNQRAEPSAFDDFKEFLEKVEKKLKGKKGK